MDPVSVCFYIAKTNLAYGVVVEGPEAVEIFVVLLLLEWL